jgi:hypothetical protein
MKRSTVLLGSIIGFAILYAAATIALGTTPEATDSGTEVVRWFRDNGDHVRLWLLFSTFALVAFAVYAAIIRAGLPSPHRDIFLVGAVALMAETGAQGWFWGGLALHPSRLEPATARTLLDVAVYWGPLLTATTITMLLPIVLLSFQRRAGLAPWLGVVALVAVVEQAIETITIFGHDGFAAPGGPMNVLLGAGLVSIAFISLGVVKSRQPA